MDLPKTYSHKEVEDQIYQRWEQSGFFAPEAHHPQDDNPPDDEVFSIAMPPANVTSVLHLGSAMFLTIEDIMTRHARMTGKKTLWLPGTDHAAIATQNVVERQIWEKEKKTRHDLGREELLKRVNDFIGRTQGIIQKQIRKIGSSCDWSREKYTLSAELSLAVRAAFKRMYDAGLIYRGERIVNWCTRCGTTLADDEVAYRQEEAKNYFIRYPFPGSPKSGIVISTVRPETMVGDTAVAVHPDDPRYKKSLDKTVIQPLVNREIPIIADREVDPKYGTGAMKVTPAHDHHDFDLAAKNKLEIINVFGLDGKVNPQEAADHGFEKYADLSIAQMREKAVADLTALGLLEKTENLKHNIALCYRCETPVEPIVSKQWFISMGTKVKIKDKETTLKEMAMDAVKSGAIKIVPERFTKIYYHWMENLRDWNISRQIWFGHQIPVWYKGEEIYVGIEAPKEDGWQQDPDTLDTWFSSGLWTFSTLGWPNQTPDLKTFHPTTILETGYDILFFWVARMILMTGFLLEDIPFRTVYLHGLVRDIKGKKMSKSKGNALDPLDVIAEYGTDALRLSLVIGTTPGNDLKFSENKTKGYRNFVNKLWNIARFVLSLSPSPAEGRATSGREGLPAAQTLPDQWILAELDDLIGAVNKNFTEHQYGLAGKILEDFTWNKFADWYIEIAKMATKRHPREGGDPSPILDHVLQALLKLWHPFIPFVTEHIWSQFSPGLLMMQPYPTAAEKPSMKNLKVKAQFQTLQDLISGLRNLRAEYRQPHGEIFQSYLEIPEGLSWIKDHIEIIEKLARVKLNFAPLPAGQEGPFSVWEGIKHHLVIPGFDRKKEMALAKKEIAEIDRHLARLKTQLEKKEFLKKAPPEIVEKLKAGSEAGRARREKLLEKIKTLK